MTSSLNNARALYETGEVYGCEIGTAAGLCAIHQALFKGLERSYYYEGYEPK